MKRTLLLSFILVLGTALLFTSCKKDKDSKDKDGKGGATSCKCEIYDEWYDGYGWNSEYSTETFDEDDLEDFRADDCDELEEAILEEIYDGDGDDDDVSCKEK